MKNHSVREARADFSGLLARAVAGEPQRVTRHGKEAVIVVSETQWEAREQAAPTLGGLLATFAETTGFSPDDLDRPFSQARELGADFTS